MEHSVKEHSEVIKMICSSFIIEMKDIPDNILENKSNSFRLGL